MNENLNPSFTGEGIYKENILDHYKNPHNRGKIANADIEFTENNPLCGDVITVDMKLDDNKIVDVKFNGQGCAISQAAMSMLTDEIKGKTLEQINHYFKYLPKIHSYKKIDFSWGGIPPRCIIVRA